MNLVIKSAQRDLDAAVVELARTRDARDHLYSYNKYLSARYSLNPEHWAAYVVDLGGAQRAHTRAYQALRRARQRYVSLVADML